MVTIDLDANPNLQFRIDSFSVPETARGEFQEAMHRSLNFLKTLPGYRGHLTFEKTGGPGAFNVATMAVWESKEAVDSAAVTVRAYYQSIGFDAGELMARLGIRAELGYFQAVDG
jgi:hypothetical protein